MTSSNKSDEVNYGESATIDFQPMPKRFMMWDKEDGDWIFDGKIFTIQDLVSEFGRVPLILETCELIQSTNLFDKDGKEIFEGSIIENPKWVHNLRVDFVRFGGYDGGIDPFVPEADDDLRPGPKDVRVIGHIFSNPELLEGRR